jgi:hypothetical protein
MLGAGLVIGVIVVFFLRRKGAAPTKPHPVFTGYLWGAASVALVAFIVRPAPQPHVAEAIAAQVMASAANGVTPAIEPSAEKLMTLPPNHPRIKTVMPATAEGLPVDTPIHITLDSAAKGGVVYVIARAEGQTSGHPLAVKRVSTDSFPLTFDFGAADSMMGEPFPKHVNVEARLDADGDAGTHDATEPKASAAGVAAGSALTLTLK